MKEVVEKKDKPSLSDIGKAITAYKKLSKNQIKLIKRKKSTNSATIDTWLNFFKDIAVFDQYGDNARQASMSMMIKLFLLLIVTVILAVITKLFPLAIVIVSVLSLAILVLRVISSLLKRYDIDNTFREFIIPTLLILKEEVNPNQKVDLSFNLYKTEKCTPKEKARIIQGGMFSYPKITEANYENQWLNISMELADGSILKVNIADFLRWRGIKKKNARGKVKTKSKFKLKQLVDVSLTLPNKQFDSASIDMDLLSQKGTVRKKGDKRTVIRQKKSFISKYDYINYPGGLTVDGFFNVITNVYKQVNPVNKKRSRHEPV